MQGNLRAAGLRKVVQRTVAKGVEKRLDRFSQAIVFPVGGELRRGLAGGGLNEAILTDFAINIDDMARESVHGVHCGNEKLPVLRLEHVDHTGKGRLGQRAALDFRRTTVASRSVTRRVSAWSVRGRAGRRKFARVEAV